MLALVAEPRRRRRRRDRPRRDARLALLLGRRLRGVRAGRRGARRHGRPLRRPRRAASAAPRPAVGFAIVLDVLHRALMTAGAAHGAAARGRGAGRRPRRGSRRGAPRRAAPAWRWWRCPPSDDARAEALAEADGWRFVARPRRRRLRGPRPGHRRAALGRRPAGGGAAIAELRICVPLGALFDDAVAALGARRPGRRARCATPAGGWSWRRGNGTTYITTRPSDVPTYVESGAADLGIVGKDVLLRALAGRLRAARPGLRRAAAWSTRPPPARTPRPRRSSTSAPCASPPSTR